MMQYVIDHPKNYSCVNHAVKKAFKQWLKEDFRTYPGNSNSFRRFHEQYGLQVCLTCDKFSYDIVHYLQTSSERDEANLSRFLLEWG